MLFYKRLFELAERTICLPNQILSMRIELGGGGFFLTFIIDEVVVGCALLLIVGNGDDLLRGLLFCYLGCVEV